MSSSTFKTIALVGRSQDPVVIATAGVLNDFLAGQGVHVLVGEDGPFAQLAGATLVDEAGINRDADLLIAVGGDGTMLHAARMVAQSHIPLVGVNRGRLGFLADISPDVMLDELAAILAGRFVSDTRMLLRAEVVGAHGGRTEALALNDIVVQKRDAGRMVEVEVHVDDTFVNTHRGDGLIITTPTGSTAYALSGGGPIMAPGLEAIAMVPICPHTLSDRPVVVAADGHLLLRTIARGDGHAQVMADGALLANLSADDVLHVEQAKQRVQLLHPSDYDYFRIVRSKLSWGRGRTANSDAD